MCEGEPKVLPTEATDEDDSVDLFAQGMRDYWAAAAVTEGTIVDQIVEVDEQLAVANEKLWEILSR